MGGRGARPIWLAGPTRFAGLGARRALIVAGGIALLLLCALAALSVRGPAPVTDTGTPSASAGAAGHDDVVLYDTIVGAMRHGDAYYPAAARELRRGGYPLKPFVTFRLPTLAAIQAHVPPPLLVPLMYALVAAVFAAWYHRLRPAFARTLPALVTMLLLAGGVAAYVQPALVHFHEIWAGLLVALSVAIRRPGRWIESVAIGLCAVLVRETAAPYLAIMAAFAWVEGERREAVGWVTAAAVLAVAVAFHAQAVAQVVRPLDLAAPGWSGMLGPGFFFHAASLATALSVLPMAVAAPLVALSVAGWAAWRDPLGARMAALLLAYAALMAVAGHASHFYWVMLVAPALLVGLVFLPDGLRDLARPILDRPRVRVQRISR